MTWLEKHKWWPDALLLKLGLITRAQATLRGVPHIKAGTKEQTELDHFQTWALWRAKGALPPRPANLKGWHPEQEYWLPLGLYMKKHHLPPPKDPPPPPVSNPPSRWKDAPWCKFHVDTSDWVRQFGPWDGLIQRCKSAGVQAVSFQFGDDCPDPDWATHGRQLYEAAKANGMDCFCWGRVDYTSWDKVRADLRSVQPIDGISADVEGELQDKDIHRKLADEFADECPLSVVATGGIDQAFGTDAIDSAVKFGDWYDFRGQDYYKANATPPFPMTIEMGENFVLWRSTEKNGGRGYRHLPQAGGKWHVPLLMSNVEGCTPLAEQEERAKAWVRSGGKLGYWIAELLEAHGEWDVFARIIRG